MPPSSTPSSSPVRVRSVARRQSLREPVAFVQAEDGLGVADVDREQHRLIVGATTARRLRSPP